MRRFKVTGKRQHSRAQHIINEMKDQGKACWLFAESQNTLCLGDPLSGEMRSHLGHWAQTGKLSSGSTLTITRWRNDCPCWGGECEIVTIAGANQHCHGHSEEVTVDSACHDQNFLLFIDGWRKDKGVNAISVYLYGVHIGSLAR